MRSAPDSESLLSNSPFDDLYGLQITHLDADSASAEVPVTPQITQPVGLVHGGVYAAIAEALASLGTNCGVTPMGHLGLGQSNSCSFVRPIGEGSIHADATRRHGGRSTWIWDVEMRDDEERLCAVSRVLVAVVKPRDT